MSRRTARVHLLCGLNGAGKSTLARELASDIPAVRFALDEWILRLYGLNYDDPAYAHSVAACQNLIWDTALQVLALGHDVVLDWNLWSRDRRSTWSERAAVAGYVSVLHHVDVSVDQAVERVISRNSLRRSDAHVIDEPDVRHLASIFEAPTDDEGIEIILHL